MTIVSNTSRMHQKIVFSIALVLISQISIISACKGCVNLDQSSFEKILPHFPAVLVKFDVAFPYGDKHEIFSKFADAISKNKDILIGEVGVKDYGEKDNEELASKYSISKDDFPVLKLFKKDAETPISFPKSTDFTIDNIRSFIRDNTDIYLGLPGCLEAFDKLATTFLETKDTKLSITEADQLVSTLAENEKEAGKTYVVLMKKIAEKGRNFIAQETERVGKLLKGKISSKKLNELQNRLNILRAFSVPRKDEL